MMSSNEVANMFQAQNQMFMGQNQYANQIGMASTHNPISYAPSGAFGPGYGGGNRFAGGAMSAMGGAATAAGAGIGMAGALGAFGRVGGAMVDPFSMFGAARGLGMGMAGSLGMAALPIAGAMAAGQVVSSFVQGGQQQSAINNTLGQNFQHFNPSARGGMGFSRQDSQMIGDQIRQLAHIPEMMTSVDELTKLMPKLKQSGMLQGVKDAGEFNRRFKDAIVTIREMSKMLGTTMDEASEFFAQSRGAGFIGKQAQLKNVMNAQFTSGVTGMSMGQVMSMQQSGANFATQVGARRSLGANAVTSTAQTLGLAQREGRITEGQLEDATGLQGADAVQAMSQRLTEGMYNFSQRSPVGKLLMAGLAKFDDTGKATGLDDDLVKQFQSGALTVDDLKRRAGKLTHNQKISFTNRQAGTLAVSLSGQIGAGGVGKFYKQIVGNKGTDAAELVLGRNTGFNEAESDVVMAMGQQGGGAGEKEAMARTLAQEAAIRERTDPSMIMKRIGTRIHSSMFGGIEGAGAKVHGALRRAYEEAVDDFVGREVMTLSKEGGEQLVRAFSGAGKEDLKSMFAAASGLSGKPASGGMLRSFRGTDAAAYILKGGLNTGRSDEAQAARNQQLLGSAGNGATIGRALNNGLAGSAGYDVSELVNQAKSGIENFGMMDNDEKMDQLKAAIEAKIDPSLRAYSGGTLSTSMLGDLDAGQRKALEDAMRKMGESGSQSAMESLRLLQGGQKSRKNFRGDWTTGLIASAQGKYEGGLGQVDFESMGGEQGINFFRSAKKTKDFLRDTEKSIEDGVFQTGFGESAMSVIKGSGAAREALLGMRGGSDKAKAIADALDQPDAIAVKRLQSLGITVKEGELDGLRDAKKTIDKTANSDRQKELYKGIQNFTTATKSQDFLVSAEKFKGLASGLRSGAAGLGKGAGADVVNNLAKAMEEYGKTGDPEGIKKANQEYMALIEKTTDPAKKDALIRAGGQIGMGASESISSLAGVKTEKDLREALKSYGEAAYGDLTKDINVADGISDSEQKDIRGRLQNMKTATIAGRDKTVTATNEDRMLKTLNNLNLTVAQLGTVLATSAEGKVKAEQLVKEATTSAKENQPVSSGKAA